MGRGFGEDGADGPSGGVAMGRGFGEDGADARQDGVLATAIVAIGCA